MAAEPDDQELDKLIRDLGRGPGRRHDSVTRLSEHGAGAVAYLLARLRDSDRNTRHAIVLGLDGMGSRAESAQRSDIVEGLFTALYDEHPPIRRRAARTLRYLGGGPRLAAAMVPWLDSPDDADRRRARSVLGERGAASAGEGWDQLAQARRAPAVTAPDAAPLPDDPDTAVTEYLNGGFPPERPIPPIPPHLLAAVRAEARGEPGDLVWPGLFPRARAKLARLALARWREYPADVVLRAAEQAYGRHRGHHHGSYFAHDALACALVHPDVDAVALADSYGGHRRGERGWKSRRKTWQLLRWARRHGYLPGLTRCACGHDWFVAPPTRRAAVASAGHWSAIGPLLVSEAVDTDRWLAVFRCSRCGGLWAEDSISSGHADLFFGYPIHTRDPRGWLAHARPLDLPA